MRRTGRFVVALLIVGSSAATVPAVAAEFDQNRVVQCMLDHTTTEQETVFKNLMVAALSDDTAGVKSSLVQLTSTMMDLALTKCEVGVSSLSSPEFQAAAKLYGQQVGEKLMKNAFAKLN